MVNHLTDGFLATYTLSCKLVQWRVFNSSSHLQQISTNRLYHCLSPSIIESTANSYFISVWKWNQTWKFHIICRHSKFFVLSLKEGELRCMVPDLLWLRKYLIKKKKKLAPTTKHWTLWWTLLSPALKYTFCEFQASQGYTVRFA